MQGQGTRTLLKFFGVALTDFEDKTSQVMEGMRTPVRGRSG